MAIDTELQAKLEDMQAQLDHLFSLHGPVRWHHVLKQRAENAKVQGNKAPFHRNQAFGEVYRPKPHEGNQ
jgi:hypothetical protein